MYLQTRNTYLQMIIIKEITSTKHDLPLNGGLDQKFFMNINETFFIACEWWLERVSLLSRLRSCQTGIVCKDCKWIWFYDWLIRKGFISGHCVKIWHIKRFQFYTSELKNCYRGEFYPFSLLPGKRIILYFVMKYVIFMRKGLGRHSNLQRKSERWWLLST